MALTPRDKELTLTLTPELLQEIEDCGKDIYHNNPFLRDVANLMEHPDFNAFYKKYFTSRDELEQLCLFMTVYDQVNEKTKSFDLNGFQKIALTKEYIHNHGLRRQVCKQIQQFFCEDEH